RLVPRLKRFGPDILFSLDHHNAMFWGRLSSIAARVPRRVVVSHSTGRMDSRKSFTAFDRLLMRFTDRVVALSATHAAYLRDVEEVDAAKIVVIENGIDATRYEKADRGVVDGLRRELGISDEHRVVAMVAALRPEKAHEALLEAADTLARDRPDLRLKLLIIGDGPRRGALEEMRNRLGLVSSVRFLGVRDDIPALLHLSDVLVLPSHPAVETLPLAVLEAMAAGTPVVASAVGSVPDIIEDGWNGRLIAPADAVGLSQAICHIFDKSQETQQIIEHARETVISRYTVQDMVSKYETLFESLLS
ncbi:MAG: glycosyltransferase, partial [Candidatus Latescibacterota bacterium]